LQDTSQHFWISSIASRSVLGSRSCGAIVLSPFSRRPVTIMGSSESQQASPEIAATVESSPVQQKISRPILHFCFLVHGWMGNEKEMDYLESALNKALVAASINSNQGVRPKLEFLVYKPICNVGKTSDGIANGGSRLAKEVKEYIRNNTRCRLLSDDNDDDFSKQTQGPEDSSSNNTRMKVQDVTISFVGNSMGGLYSRYAIAKLCDEHQTKNGFVLYDVDDKDQASQRMIRVHFNVFSTTSCPHLGVQRHTYIPIPRFLETAIAHFMSDTGKDLFRLTGIIREMALTPRYLNPLGSFRRRIAYANAHKTDFQVPTSTAAFLCQDSRYPHKWVSEGNTMDDLLKDVMVATFYTEKDARDPHELIDDYSLSNYADTDQLEMSAALDSLGWKKVFTDVRGLLPFSFKIPFLSEQNLQIEFKKERYSSGRSSFNQNEKGVDEGEGNNAVIIESRRIIPLVSTSDRIFAPFGHTVMVANSKSMFYSWLNRKGRPVMDRFAEELVNEIGSWRYDDV